MTAFIWSIESDLPFLFAFRKPKTSFLPLDVP